MAVIIKIYNLKWYSCNTLLFGRSSFMTVPQHRYRHT
jgi:hypothetical protein